MKKNIEDLKKNLAIKDENKVFIFESGFVACSKCAESCGTYYNGIEGLKEIIDASVEGSYWECENCGKAFNPIETY